MCWRQARIAVSTTRGILSRYRWDKKTDKLSFFNNLTGSKYVINFVQHLETALQNATSPQFVLRYPRQENTALPSPNYMLPNNQYVKLLDFVYGVNVLQTMEDVSDLKRFGLRLNPEIVYRLPSTSDEVCVVATDVDVVDFPTPPQEDTLEDGQFFEVPKEFLNDGAIVFSLAPSTEENSLCSPKEWRTPIADLFQIDWGLTTKRRMFGMDTGISREHYIVNVGWPPTKGIFVPGTSNMKLVAKLKGA